MTVSNPFIGGTIPGPLTITAGGTALNASGGNVNVAGTLISSGVTSNGGVDARAPGFSASEGANGKQGVATLVAGTVTVANTSITANSRIILTPQETGALTGIVRVSARVVGTSFTITSTVNTDTAVVAFEIFEPG